MSSYIDGKTLIHAFEIWAPKTLAEDWDNVGLLVGTLNKEIKKVMITLDVLENVVDEAVEKKVDLIFAHHPLIFRSMNHVLTDEGQSRVIAKCIKHDIAVYAAHTNLDMANGGMNDFLAETLGLIEPEILVPTETEKLFKLAVFVPVTHADRVREALCEAGAGAIGGYSHCTFNTMGKGTFKPEAGANPFLGEVGKLEIADEVKIETILTESQLQRVIDQMLTAHPYEEVAYDVFPLKNKGAAIGLGRIGSLPEALTLKALAQQVKKTLGFDGVRIVGDPEKLVQKVAVIGGDGNDFIKDVAATGADVFITGDIKYHIAHDALYAGLSVIDAGHHMEKVMKKGVADFFRVFLDKQEFAGTEVVESEANTNPFIYV